ncbi:uncharacterized protein VTP21DRAFT_5534 [Calcarisporiella thermophila]|uniref:uncharacterized protein n=1 Tax=Calcarisporiella thermophila TaxID=911321 RepID=UPI003743D470
MADMQSRFMENVGHRHAPIDQRSLYDYALRCAILTSWEEIKAPIPTVADTSASTPAGPENKHRFSSQLGLDQIQRLSMNLTQLDFNLAENKDVTLTRDLIRGLLRRIQAIVKGREASMNYKDPIFKTALSLYEEPLRMLKHNRIPQSVEELILGFARISKVELQKASPTAMQQGRRVETWQERLNEHTALFAGLVREVLTTECPKASEEIVGRVNSFIRAGSTRSRPHSALGTVSASGNGSGVAAGVGDRAKELIDVPLIKHVQSLFQVPNREHSEKVRKLSLICSEKAALDDIMRCIDYFQQGGSFPYTRRDFVNESAYKTWRNREMQQLNGLSKALQLKQLNSIKSPQDLQLAVANQSQSTSPPSGSAFTFVPSDPRGYFRFLVNFCLEYELQMRGPEDLIKGKVFSPLNDTLMRECVVRWRLSPYYRTVLLLELIISRYNGGQLAFDHVKDAFTGLLRVLKEIEVTEWAVNDRGHLLRVLETLNRSLVEQLGHALSEYYAINPEWIHELDRFIERVYEIPIFQAEYSDPSIFFNNELLSNLEAAAVKRYHDINAKIAKAGCGNEIEELELLSDRLTNEYQILAKRFPQPITHGNISIPSIVMGRQMVLFILQMENLAHLSGEDIPTDLVFDLYQKVLLLRDIYQANCPGMEGAQFKLEPWFYPYVKQYLLTTDEKTKEWVQNAINQDNFKPVSENVDHSSSVVDLFDSFNQAVDFIQRLQWPNELQLARFMTQLSKTICRSIDRYCESMEHLFFEEMMQYPADKVEKRRGSSQGLWFTRAKNKNGSGGRTGDAFNFTLESCVKLNNIEATRIRLDQLYQLMDVDSVASLLQSNGPPVPSKDTVSPMGRHLFSIKIVAAEDIKPMDKNGLSDPYVVLRINDSVVARTRTIYETLNPRWDQTFDLSVDGVGNLIVEVWDEDIVGKNEIAGKGLLVLGPDNRFSDFQVHEISLPLDTQGKILLRVSMEGERDEILFWFGKAFRRLKRTETDMASYIVEKMSSVINSCLSRSTISKLVKPEKRLSIFSSKNSASSASFSSSLADISIAECEAALNPLVEYFERNLKTLNDSLSMNMMTLVLIRLWKEVLARLEGLLIPPLADTSSGMRLLGDTEVVVVIKWLELLKLYFNGGEEGNAVPIERLETTKYRDLIQIPQYYDRDPETLMTDYIRLTQVQGGRRQAIQRQKSVAMSHNLGSIRKRKMERRHIAEEAGMNPEVVLRILRMHASGNKRVKEFLREQMALRNKNMRLEGESMVALPTEDMGIGPTSAGRRDLPPLPTSMAVSY